MDKREMIGKALNQMVSERVADTTVIGEVFKHPSVMFSSELMFNLAKEVKDAIIDVLAEQAIVIECEVEHARFEDQYKPVYDKDVTYIQGGDGGWPLHYNGHHGTPGKAIAIILSLEEE